MFYLIFEVNIVLQGWSNDLFKETIMLSSVIFGKPFYYFDHFQMIQRIYYRLHKF